MKRLEVTVQTSGHPLRIDSGSVMHGIIMELLPPPWPARLHEDGNSTMSQWLEPKENGKCIWHIGILQDDLGDILYRQLQSRENLYSAHHQEFLRIDGLQKREILPEDLLASFLMNEEIPAGIRLFFRSPTTHKSKGEYVLFPSLSLIVGSLQKKMVRVWPDNLLADETLGQQIAEQSRITRYKLKTCSFGLEGTRVNGYTGSIDIRFRGEDMLRRLSAAVFSLSEWAGVGIKTALGMGGCTIYHLKRGEKAL